ncbi:MAG: hypothetical protein KJZ80_10390 [Hyphomicrobiaceae bacterium]|nr:hypothetical protein [Hyphomicrobiaceae bacterium]
MSSSAIRARNVVGVFAAIALAEAIGAGSIAARAEVWSGRNVVITGILAQPQLAAGNRVRVEATVSDDVFVAGRRVVVERARADSLAVGSVRLAVRDSTVRNLVAGALDVEIQALVENVAVVGVCPICWWERGRVLIGPGGRIGGDAYLAARTIELFGSVGGNLRARASRIVITGAVAGTAELRANRIVIAPGARITGELIARSPEPPQVAPDAIVTGGVRYVPADPPIPDAYDIRWLSWQLSLAVAAVFVAGLLVFVMLAQAIVPGLLWQSVQQFRSEPWGTLGRGIAWALLAPTLIFLLFASLIGIPAGFVLAGLFFVLLGLSLVTAAYGLGLWLRDRRQPGGDPGTAWRRIGWTVVGLVLILIAALIPIIGWIAVVLALLTGLGAVGTSVWRRLRGHTAAGAAPEGSPGAGSA